MAVQVIDDELEFNKDLEKFMIEGDVMDNGLNYNSVAIIGCQSSGKSTLLNLVFDTEFEVLDAHKVGRQQTTKGVWLSINGRKDVIILDIEGTDSVHRGDNRLTFEQTTSLFALAVADILLINMWTSDIGRYTASNYKLLEVIFEVNLKLFGQDKSNKKLVFILRDFSERENSKKII